VESTPVFFEFEIGMVKRLKEFAIAGSQLKNTRFVLIQFVFCESNRIGHFAAVDHVEDRATTVVVQEIGVPEIISKPEIFRIVSIRDAAAFTHRYDRCVPENDLNTVEKRNQNSNVEHVFPTSRCEWVREDWLTRSRRLRRLHCLIKFIRTDGLERFWSAVNFDHFAGGFRSFGLSFQNAASDPVMSKTFTG
jgi:hypothetical protein